MIDDPENVHADLSPAARAVWDAFNCDSATHLYGEEYEEFRVNLVAAFRALANHQPQPRTQDGPLDHWDPDDRTRRELHNIAAELEGRNG
jgi:hypothetical protein